jgi:glutathione S-transferase
MALSAFDLEIDVKLYYMPGACSLASHIALQESGSKFEIAAVDRKNRTTSDGLKFEQVNPKGYVPALRLDDGQILTENVAVLLYIADRNPGARLAPSDASIERYRLIEWLAFISSEIHKGFSPLFHPAAGEETKQHTRNALAKRLDWLNGAVGARSFLQGDGFTVADAYLYTVLRWSERVQIELARWPNLKRYHVALGARASVVAALRAEGLA